MIYFPQSVWYLLGGIAIILENETGGGEENKLGNKCISLLPGDPL